MRIKTLAVAAVVHVALGTATVAGCRSSSGSGSAEPSAAAPSPPTPDFMSYVSDVMCGLPPSDSGFGGQADTVHIQFTLTNRSNAPLKFDFTFAVKDSTGTQIATFGVDYGVIAGPLAAGTIAKYDDYHGMATGHLPGGPFSCALTDVSVS